MSTTQNTSPVAGLAPGRRTTVACGLGGAALSVAAVVALGDPLLGAESGAAVTESLVAAAGAVQLSALLAGLSAAALVVASVALGARAGAWGRVLALGGVLTALLMAAYFAAFGGGALVATQVLDDAGAGVGEATLVAANQTALVRYVGGLLLLGAAAAAGVRRGAALPRWVGWSAVAFLVLLVVPITGWVVALVLPAWLGVVAAAMAWRDS